MEIGEVSCCPAAPWDRLTVRQACLGRTVALTPGMGADLPAPLDRRAMESRGGGGDGAVSYLCRVNPRLPTVCDLPVDGPGGP